MQLLAISRTVKEGTDNNDTGDVNLAGVTIQLLDSKLGLRGKSSADEKIPGLDVPLRPGNPSGKSGQSPAC